VLPGWLARAFGQDHLAGHSIDFDPPQPPPRRATTDLATLSAAFRDAQRLGKPLLVVVVPANESDEAYWDRPMAIGELLNHGSDDAMVTLAMTHVVCAKMADLRQLVPTAPAGEPLLVLVETDRVPAASRAIDPGLAFPRIDAFGGGGPGRRAESFEQRQARGERAIDARLTALTTALHQAVAPDAGTLAARAQLARAHADGATLAAIDQAVRGGRPVDGPLADRAAAVLALAATTAPANVAATLRQSLVKGAQARLRDARVPGS